MKQTITIRGPAMEKDRNKWRKNLLQDLHRITSFDLQQQAREILEPLGERGQIILQYIEKLETENVELREDKASSKERAIALVLDVQDMAKKTIELKAENNHLVNRLL